MAMGCTLFTIPQGITSLVMINIGFVGAAIVPIIPVGYEFAVELTYPLPETTVNGLSMTVA